MLRWAITICIILSPLIAGYPQSASSARYETEQDYTDSPSAKLVSLNYEPQTERPAAKQLAKAYRPRRPQQQYQSQPQGQYQSQQYSNDYQTQPQAAPQAQSDPSLSQNQYEQQQQYESQYINQARQSQSSQASQQPARQEHRHSTTTTPIPIIRLDKVQGLDGSYQQSWETGNNIIAQENGYLKHLANDQNALVQTGNYTYIAPDGSVVWTSYTADEDGFKVEGSHLPTPPPIPEEIQKGLEKIYAGIRLQQEQAAKEAKYGKTKPSLEEDNSVISGDNYPQQYRPYKQQQQQQQQQQYQQYQQQQPQQPQQPQQKQQQYEEPPQTYRPVVQTYRKAQRSQSQKYQQIQSQQAQPSKQIQQAQPEYYEQ